MVRGVLQRFSVGGTNSGGRLVLDDADEFRGLMSRMADGVLVRVTVEEDKDKRPNWLNRFYWGFPIKLTAEHYGYTKDEMHEAWKWRFLRLEDPDHPIPTVRSTTDLSEEEMKDFIQQIRIAAAEDGIQVPEINEHMESLS